MNNRPFTLFVCLTFATICATAQSTVRPSMYFQQMNYYNVASTLADSSEKASLLYYTKNKLVQSETWNKPMTSFISQVGRLNNIPGFYSAAYIYDSYSFYDRHTLYAGYTHQWKLGKKQQHVINVGARTVLNFDHIKWDKLGQVVDRSKAGLHFTPDVDLGVQYQFKRLNLGVASKNIFSNTAKFDGEILLQNHREWYYTASYTFTIKKNYNIAPYILVYQERRNAFDFGLFASAYKRVSVSYILRLLEFRHIYMVNVNIVNGLHAGFAYDYSSVYSDKHLDFLIGYRF